jgi:hypothetical protein
MLLTAFVGCVQKAFEMSKPIPNLSKDAHLEGAGFRATAELSANLCRRSLKFTPQAFDLGLQDSKTKQERILSEEHHSLPIQERIAMLSAEEEREEFFKEFGRNQHLVSVTLLAYATLDTVLSEAVRLLATYCNIAAPKQNSRGSSITINLAHLQNTTPFKCEHVADDETVLNEFIDIRNLLIHQGYFLNPADKRFEKLRCSHYHIDYFEVREGFPIHLHAHGVGRFVEICSRIINAAGEHVHRIMLSQ